MKAIYYDGSAEGASDAARAARAALPPTVGHIRLRDAHAWAQLPEQGIERFAAAVIPAGEAFDELAQAYVDSGAEVLRGEPAASAAWLEAAAEPAAPDLPTETIPTSTKRSKSAKE